jgi:hypothetical protein
MVVAAPTTPANYFHLLRRQALQSHKRPLVVLSPKSMLRLRAASSAVEDFVEKGFAPVLGDPDAPDPQGVERVVLTAGKVFYDLLAARRKSGDTRVALVRVEQLYPVPGEELADALALYPGATDVVWCQEEPANQGAWAHVALSLPDHLPEGRSLRRVSRRAGASPAAGSSKVHEAEQASSSRRPWASSEPASSERALGVYFTDRGLEELAERRGEEQVSLAWLASACASSSTSTPTSRSPSSAWRPGWRDWTTTRSDAPGRVMPRAPGVGMHVVPQSPGGRMNTRSIATIALVIAVLLLLFLVVLPRL